MGDENYIYILSYNNRMISAHTTRARAEDLAREAGELFEEARQAYRKLRMAAQSPYKNRNYHLPWDAVDDFIYKAEKAWAEQFDGTIIDRDLSAHDMDWGSAESYNVTQVEIERQQRAIFAKDQK